MLGKVWREEGEGEQWQEEEVQKEIGLEEGVQQEVELGCKRSHKRERWQ